MRTTAAAILATIALSAGAQNEVQKYMFDGDLPVCLDQMQQELTFPHGMGQQRHTPV